MSGLGCYNLPSTLIICLGNTRKHPKTLPVLQIQSFFSPLLTESLISPLQSGSIIPANTLTPSQLVDSEERGTQLSEGSLNVQFNVSCAFWYNPLHPKPKTYRPEEGNIKGPGSKILLGDH